jgi:hypothetical protein
MPTWVDKRYEKQGLPKLVDRMHKFRCCSCGHHSFGAMPESLTILATPACAWTCLKCGLMQIDPPLEVTRCINCMFLTKCLGLPRINFAQGDA